MNKSYKVVWSKAKHCYVVTSELAKRQTKGCGARSLRMAAVSLGVTASLLCAGAVLPIFGESVAEAGQVTNVDDARVTADNAENSIVYGNNTGNIKEEKDDAVSLDGNTISINITKTLHRVYGGYSSVISAYTVSGNTVNIEKGTIQTDFGDAVNGGYSTNGGKITGNTVNVSVGSITGRVVGGCSMYGNVSGNAVNISGEMTTINGDICGGDRAVGNQGSDVDSTTDNTVVISGGNVTGDVYGGTSSYFGGDITKNKVYIDGGTITGTVTGGKTLGQGNITNNEVHISKGSVTGDVYGGAIKENVTGEVKGNKVEITGGIINEGHEVHGGHSLYNSVGGTGENDGNKVIISGGEVHCNVVGGYSSNKSAIGNSVEISGGKVGPTSNTAYIYGGYSFKGAATDNKVSINSGTIGEGKNAYVYGGYADLGAADTNEVNLNGGKIGKFSYVSYIFGGRGKTSASGNTVNITGGAFENGSLYGGYSSTGTADTNIISMTGGTLSNTSIHGGRSGASASGNEVTVSGGLAGYVYGGAATYNTGKMNQNKVTVTGEETVVSGVIGGQDGVENNDNTVLIEDGSTVKVDVYGGYSTGAGSAINNKVTVTDSTVNGNVFGGVSFRGAEAVTKNAVTINNSTIGKNVYGGRQYDNESGTAFSVTGNIVTINGGTFAADKQMYGGFTYSGTTTDNIINLTGTTTGLEGVEIYGGSQSANTGNELHVGGTKTYDTSGNFVTNSGDVWQGSSNNTVKKVANFEKIVLHSVKWDKDVAALEATTVENVKTLDITDLKFYTDAAGTTQKTSFEEGESMALLKSVESDLSSVKLDYKSGDAVVTGVAITTEGVTLGGGATDKTETDGVNGVKLTQSVTEKVKLATDSKAISYSCEVGDVKGVTFNASTPITFSKTEVARDLTGKTFATSNTINAEGLKFKETNEAIAVSDSMTLISNATGIITTVTNETGKTVAITNYEDNQKIKYNATASGTVTSDGSAVKYTVGSVTVSSIDLSGWTGTASDLPKGNTSGWTGAGVSVAGSFTAPDIAANSSRDIVITNKSGFFTVDAIDDSIKYAAVDFSDDEANGVTLAGSQSKGVQAASDGTNDGAKLVYAVGTKDVTGITLGTMTAVTPRTMEAGYDFTGVTTINAGNLQFDKPEDVKANMTLVANATNLLEGKTVTDADHTQDFTKTATNSVALTASLKGTVETVSGAVNYTYSGTELKTINLANWNGNEATFDATGWTKGASATVETDGLSVTVDPGVEKTVLTVSGGVVLTGITVNGEAYQWKDGGESIAETSAENGVKITAGVTTGGGIKGDGNKIIYKGSSKTVTGLEVTSVDFVKDGVAREFKNDYDLTNAAITVASGISVSNTASMNAGDTMVVVDAVNAIKGTGDATLQDFTTTNAGDAIAFTDQIEGKALTLSGTHQDMLEQNEAKNQILYKVGDKNVTAAIFTGEVAWNASEAYYTNDTSKYKIAATNVDATDLKVTGTSTKALQKGDAMTLFSAEGMTATLAKDQSDANKTASKITVNYSDATSGIGFGAEATGAVETAAGAVNYKVTGVTMNRVDLAGWNGTTSSVPGGWAIADGATINTDGLAAPAVEPGSHVDILQNDTDNYFASATISGANTYRSTDFKDEMNGVTLEGKQDKGVTLNSEKKHLIYAVGTKNTASVSFGAVEWQKDATLADAAAGYDFTNVSEIGTDKFDVTYAKPEDVAINDSMTLLKANETLTAIVDELKTSSYKNYEIAPGVLMDGSITGTMSRSGNDVVFTATANQADKLTFTDVEWKDSGALLTRPANVMFAGADVDTAKINFHNIQELAANSRMTLVSDFGETVGTITGDTFTVGSGLQGEGAASLSGTDLVFTAKTGAESLTPTEATHETVMAMEAGTAVVAAGREYVDSAVEGLGLVSNMAPDGTSTFASMGGGVGRYKTGSHVDTHTWNAVVAVGSKRDHKKGNLEWGVFAEYGRGNYTLHDDNGGRGDGNTHYAGGGLLAKWTNKHDVYTEASFRMGRMSDSASNMLRDVLGNTYGYDVHANYFGGHVGLGKIYKVKGNKDLDVYGKFFYTRRNGVDFDAGGNHYSLDSVASKLLRIGARYGSNDRKWNWYGGLAYEYEFGGESKGTVDGLAIRSASIKGASVRGEIGVRLEATKTNPWKADISIYGYGGKHRGIGGTVSVAYMF